MEVSSQEEGAGEIPIPINSSTSNIIYGGGGGGHSTTTNGHGHMNILHHHIHQDHPHPLLHHHHIISPSSAPPQNPSNGCSSMQLQPPPAGLEADHGPYNNNNNNNNNKKVVIRYRECLKNHAAAMGGNATDGCGEFMPSGEEGTIEALNCSACHCHRNFHRKEVEGEPPCDYQQHHTFHRLGSSRKFILGHPHPHPHHNKNILSPEALGYTAAATAGNILPSRSVPPHGHHMIMPFNFNYNIGASTSLPSESDEQEDAAAGGGVVATRPSTCTTPLVVKKRFRTKFTQDQKEKMLSFAEKVGWKIQKQEESLVQHFCQEIGIKRRVLKVWMHNNKHNLAKKNLPPPPPTTTAA